MHSLTIKFAIFSTLLLGVTAQIPTERSENCGSILSSVISVCSHPTLSRPDWCCNELIKWNEARCWCEPNAFDALDTIASNGFAYSFRDGFCPAAFQRLARGMVEPQYATCEAYESVAVDDDMEQCTNIDATTLRTQRFASLDVLKDDKVANTADLIPWFNRMDMLFAEEAIYENVGLFLGRGRFEVKQYMMTRQEVYGFEPMTAEFTGDHFWRNPRMVSYTGGATTSNGYFNKREFVTFAPCSAQIETVHSVEDNYQTRYNQYWNASNTRLMLRYQQSSTEWCADVAARCTGANFPYTSMADCVAYHTELKTAGRVTCNKFEQDYIPQYAAHGDTIGCRTFYLDLAAVDAAGACPAVGKEPNQGRCGDTQCPGNSYIDPFARDASEAQFTSVASFTCNAGRCVENWPTPGQIESIPESERDRFTQTPPTSPPTAVPSPIVMATESESFGMSMGMDEEESMIEETSNMDQNMGARGSRPDPSPSAPAKPDQAFGTGNLGS